MHKTGKGGACDAAPAICGGGGNMCLVSVYGKKKDEENETLLLKNVSKILVDGENISFYDILGGNMKVRGSITEADLEENTVKLKIAG